MTSVNRKIASKIRELEGKKRRYYLSHSTIIVCNGEKVRVMNSLIKRIVVACYRGWVNEYIAVRLKTNKDIVSAVKIKFMHLYEPVMNLDLILHKKVYQPYNKYGIVNCACGKFHSLENKCEEIIKN